VAAFLEFSKYYQSRLVVWHAAKIVSINFSDC
jgi:hypothetical protein